MAISAENITALHDTSSQVQLVDRAKRNDLVFASMGLIILFIVMAFCSRLSLTSSMMDWLGSTMLF